MPVAPLRDLTTGEGRSAALEELALPGPTAPLGTVGYGMGGRFAVQAGATRPADIAAVTSFHAGRMATDDADSPHLLHPHLRAEVEIGHADNGSMPPEQQHQLEQALTEAGLFDRTLR